jgi:hypothetical protein
MTAVRTLAAALIAVALVGTGGCAEPEPGPDLVNGAETWAKSVCLALNPWRTQIADLTEQAQQQMGSAKTPEQTKANLVALLSGAEQSSEDARRKIVDAGVPPVPDGRKIADRFTTSLAKARDAYGQARKSVTALPTADPKRFYDGVLAAFTKLTDEYAASAIDTQDIGSTELQRAFDESAECG